MGGEALDPGSAERDPPPEMDLVEIAEEGMGQITPAARSETRR